MVNASRVTVLVVISVLAAVPVLCRQCVSNLGAGCDLGASGSTRASCAGDVGVMSETVVIPMLAVAVRESNRGACCDRGVASSASACCRGGNQDACLC